jgi:hypothetical protein
MEDDITVRVSLDSMVAGDRKSSEDEVSPGVVGEEVDVGAEAGADHRCFVRKRATSFANDVAGDLKIERRGNFKVFWRAGHDPNLLSQPLNELYIISADKTGFTCLLVSFERNPEPQALRRLCSPEVLSVDRVSHDCTGRNILDRVGDRLCDSSGRISAHGAGNGGYFIPRHERICDIVDKDGCLWRNAEFLQRLQSSVTRILPRGAADDD